MNYFRGLTTNSRFYILVGFVCVSLIVLGFLRVTIISDQLFYIRLQQVYGMIAVLLLYLAVLMTPLSKLVSKKSRFMSFGLFARRAIGVASAYFAVLHTLIALHFQFGGVTNLDLLPERFWNSFILGGIALAILTVMAITSFDKAIELLTFKRWKLIHRFVYLAGVLVVVHVWLIGTHADQTNVRVIGAILLCILFALEAARFAKSLAGKYSLNTSQMAVTAVLIFMVLSGSLLLLPELGGNYHEEHHSTSLPGDEK